MCSWLSTATVGAFVPSTRETLGRCVAECLLAPYDSGVEQSSHPQKPGVEGRTSWALLDADSTS